MFKGFLDTGDDESISYAACTSYECYSTFNLNSTAVHPRRRAAALTSNAGKFDLLVKCALGRALIHGSRAERAFCDTRNSYWCNQHIHCVTSWRFLLSVQGEPMSCVPVAAQITGNAVVCFKASAGI